MKMPESFADQLVSLRARWRGLAARERTLVSIAASVIGLAILWWLLIAPALQTLRSAAQQRTQLTQQLQQMRSMQAQAKTLQATTKVNSSDAVVALEASVKQLGASAQMNKVGERATVTLKAVSPDALAQWLAQARINARALPLEAHLVQSAETGDTQWSGTVVMRLP
jgi:general secretion pathway protein M